MSYQVLARKYRPRDFSELIGQDELVKTISNGIKSGRIHHAYLLTGIRGVGKTTTARIIAKNLNCNLGPTLEPCHECDHCKLIGSFSHPDVIEFDAASHTGVADIKEMMSGVYYAPAMGRYKVYIIDEVHMLSKQAFNSLLKTLEEPPKNVIFVFATTEMKKVPITIVSRCQKFFLGRVELDIVAKNMKGICDKEEIDVPSDVLDLIARYSEGSIRDSLSLLDQVIISTKYDEAAKIDKEYVANILRLTDQELLSSIIAECIKSNATGAYKIFEKISNADYPAFVGDIMEVVSKIIKHKSGAQVNLDINALDISKTVNLDTLIRYWGILEETFNSVQLLPSGRLCIEIMIAKLSYVSSLPSGKDIIDTLANSDSPLKELGGLVSTVS